MPKTLRVKPLLRCNLLTCFKNFLSNLRPSGPATSARQGRANRRHRGQGPMDQRIESFLADVLALAGKNPDAIREGVRVAFADCEAIFRAQEANKRMKEKATHACHALCRARSVEEMQRRKGTRIAEH